MSSDTIIEQLRTEVVYAFKRLVPDYKSLNDDQIIILKYYEQLVDKYVNGTEPKDPVDISAAFQEERDGKIIIKRRNGKSTMVIAIVCACLEILPTATLITATMPFERDNRRFNEKIKECMKNRGVGFGDSFSSFNFVWVSNDYSKRISVVHLNPFYEFEGVPLDMSVKFSAMMPAGLSY
jgi:hypothetical protein